MEAAVSARYWVGDVAGDRDYFEGWGRIELRANSYIDAAPDLIANHQRRCLAAQATTVRVPTGEALRDGLDRLVRGISGS